LKNYSHNNLAGENFNQEIEKIFKNSLKGELFNRYFLGIRIDKEKSTPTKRVKLQYLRFEKLIPVII